MNEHGSTLGDVADNALDTGETSPSKDSPRPEQVQSLERGLAVILAFANGRQHLTIADVARTVGVPRPTARRFLSTLESLGYVQSDGRRYSLLPSVLDLGYRFFATKSWWPDAQKIAQSVSSRFSMPCAVGVIDDMAAIYVAYATPYHREGHARAVGTRLPAHASAIGQVLLSGLDRDDLTLRLRSADLTAFTAATITSAKTLATRIARVRAEGFAFVSCELEVGLASIGVPILNRGGEVVAAMSVSFGSDDTPPEFATLLGPMRDAARKVTRLLPN